MNTMTRLPKMLFPFGRILMTPNLESALLAHHAASAVPQDAVTAQIGAVLERHAIGDWGCVCDEDKQSNNEALTLGNRVLSAYPIDPAKPCEGHGDNTIWIITEADRSVTTLLLPEDY